MSLVAGYGPFGLDPAGWFSPRQPDAAVYVEPHPRRIVALLDGRTMIDTERALMVHRRGHALSYAFPSGDAQGLPHYSVPEAPGYVQVPWNAVDAWFEEGRKLVHYPPNPYHRVDCRPTNRGLRVRVADTVLVDTVDTVIVFETSLRARLYVDPSQLRTDMLHRSETTTYCNYKGHATYWSTTIGDTLYEDIAWSYDDTLPETTPIQRLLSFDETRVDVIAELPEMPGAAADCGCEV